MSIKVSGTRMNYKTVVVATIAAFVASALWYSVLFGKAYADLRGGFDNVREVIIR